MEHNMLPRVAQKSNSATPLLVDTEAVTQTVPTPITEDLDAQIRQAQADMERAAKSLDFLAAARYRDLMLSLQRQKEQQGK